MVRSMNLRKILQKPTRRNALWDKSFIKENVGNANDLQKNTFCKNRVNFLDLIRYGFAK